MSVFSDDSFLSGDDEYSNTPLDTLHLYPNNSPAAHSQVRTQAPQKLIAFTIASLQVANNYATNNSNYYSEPAISPPQPRSTRAIAALREEEEELSPPSSSSSSDSDYDEYEPSKKKASQRQTQSRSNNPTLRAATSRKKARNTISDFSDDSDDMPKRKRQAPSRLSIEPAMRTRSSNKSITNKFTRTQLGLDTSEEEEEYIEPAATSNYRPVASTGQFSRIRRGAAASNIEKSLDSYAYNDGTEPTGIEGEYEEEEDIVDEEGVYYEVDDNGLAVDNQLYNMPVFKAPVGGTSIDRVLRHVDQVNHPEDNNVEDTSDEVTPFPADAKGLSIARWYLIKWCDRSHWHNTWNKREEFANIVIGGIKKLDVYDKKRLIEYNLERDMNEDELEQIKIQRAITNDLDMDALTPERIFYKRSAFSSHRPDIKNEMAYLIKWSNQPYNECTYEFESLIIEKGFEKLISDFADRDRRLQSDILRYKLNNYIPLQPNKRFIPYTSTPFYLCNDNAFKKETTKELENTEDSNKTTVKRELRDYQLIGINWILNKFNNYDNLNNNVLLADEMGLGKTAQTITTIGYYLFEQKLAGSVLIVVPQSTCDNWMNEFKMWLPCANVILYHGNGVARRIIRERELTCELQLSNNTRSKKYKFDVVITTPSILSSKEDYDYLLKIHWLMMVVDEAHQLKNRQSKRFIELIKLRTHYKLLLTGTPLQNNLEELFSLLHFLEPGRFRSYQTFIDKYSELENTNAIGINKQNQLLSMQQELQEYILRRVKRDVEKSMPKKVERILRVEMNSIQSTLYKLILTKNYEELSKNSGSKTSLQNICIELKKLCNHPFLISPSNSLTTEEYNYDLLTQSSKLILLDKLLERMRIKGNRVLIFSQMVKMLNILSTYLSIKNYPYQRLDGTMKKETRLKAMQKFNDPDSKDFVFLLSTKAGGLGINLTSADTVIIYDSDWNPQNDLQAEARAHRLGQKKTVQIYRLITKDTIEETILERAKSKMVLDTLVVQGLNKKNHHHHHQSTQGHAIQQHLTNNSFISSAGGVATAGADNGFSKDDLSKILKFGATKLWEDKNEEKNIDLDMILAEAEDKAAKGDDDSVADNLFSSFGNVTDFSYDHDHHKKMIQDDGGNRNNKDFWNDIIPEEERKKLFREKQAALEITGPRSTKVRNKNIASQMKADPYDGELVVSSEGEDGDKDMFVAKPASKKKAASKKTKLDVASPSVAVTKPERQMRILPHWFTTTVGNETTTEAYTMAKNSVNMAKDIFPSNDSNTISIDDKHFLYIQRGLLKFGCAECRLHDIIGFMKSVKNLPILPAVIILNISRLIMVMIMLKAEECVGDSLRETKTVLQKGIINISHHLKKNLTQHEIDEMTDIAKDYKCTYTGKTAKIEGGNVVTEDKEGSKETGKEGEGEKERDNDNNPLRSTWITIGGGKVNTVELIERVRSSQIIYRYVYKMNNNKNVENEESLYALLSHNFNISLPKWKDCQYQSMDDNKVIIGIIKHGYSNWIDIVNDPVLQFSEEIKTIKLDKLRSRSQRIIKYIEQLLYTEGDEWVVPIVNEYNQLTGNTTNSFAPSSGGGGSSRRRGVIMDDFSDDEEEEDVKKAMSNISNSKRGAGKRQSPKTEDQQNKKMKLEATPATASTNIPNSTSESSISALSDEQLANYVKTLLPENLQASLREIQQLRSATVVDSHQIIKTMRILLPKIGDGVLDITKKFSDISEEQKTRLENALWIEACSYTSVDSVKLKNAYLKLQDENKKV